MAVVASIVEVDATRREPVGTPLTVDFNPQTLRLTHTATGPGATQGVSKAAIETTAVARQATGYTTSLSMDLLFDSSRDGSDVRARTLVLVALTRPQGNGSTAGRSLRFSWGSFLFTGYIETLGETIDLFSPDGVPLRATVALSLRGLGERDSRPSGGAGFGLAASAGITGGFSASASAGASAGLGVSAGASVGASFGAGLGAGVSAGGGGSPSFGASSGLSGGIGPAASAGASAAVGTTPLTLTTSGDTVQSIAARAGLSWKAVATANGIDNPRLLAPGTVLNLRVSTS